MRHPCLLALLAATAAASNAQNVQFELIPGIYPADMSADGTVLVGNNFAFETLRWTRESGLVNLGRGTFIPLGVGAGTPDISDDGTRISATITTDDGQYATQGLWTLGDGWEDILSPLLPEDGGLIDRAYGSAWGLSGNGEHVVGLYWRPGNGGPSGDGLAHASFLDGNGIVSDLGSTMRDSRANHANYDGSVVVGWDTSHSFGYWSPTVWEDGTLTHLNTNQGWAMANYVTPDGNIIGGDTYNETELHSDATLWQRSGSDWTETVLGSLPFTLPNDGIATVLSMTPDGSVVVGYNQFNRFSATGFIWTAESGMEDIETWLIDRGIDIPSNLDINSLTSISADGTIMAGIGIDVFDGSPIGFMINTQPPCLADRADLDGNGVLDFFDVSAFLDAFGAQDPAADFTDDGAFDFFDVSDFLDAFATSCD
tara:strand:- start:1028 stop:2308 length:1281 start_codon:yes stop_codon:yes gene_type:complete